MNFKEIKSTDDLEQVSRKLIWQNFERLTAFIFEENDYQVQTGQVKTFNRKKRQFDVIARKDRTTYLIECKKWSGSRPRLSALKAAVAQHKERCEFFRDLTGESAIPVLVTLVEEEIQFYEGVPVVPIFRLNSFIDEMERNAIVCPPEWESDKI